jgi:hypothetical protein
MRAWNLGVLCTHGIVTHPCSIGWPLADLQEDLRGILNPN